MSIVWATLGIVATPATLIWALVAVEPIAVPKRAMVWVVRLFEPVKVRLPPMASAASVVGL